MGLHKTGFYLIAHLACGITPQKVQDKTAKVGTAKRKSSHRSNSPGSLILEG